MARSIVSLGMPAPLAWAMAVRSAAFVSALEPPLRAACMSSRMTRVKAAPRLASAAAFLCLMVAHLLWPDMPASWERAHLAYRLRPRQGRDTARGVVAYLARRPERPYNPRDGHTLQSCSRGG